MKVWWDLYAGIDIDLGTYDITNWPRHTLLKAASEIKALKALEATIARAERAVVEISETSNQGSQCHDGRKLS